MSAIRLYLDEDSMQSGLIAALRLRGIDSTSAYEAGMGERSDDEQLVWCRDQGRVLYTFNVRDFPRIHRDSLQAGTGHAGIIIGVQQRYSIGEQMRRLLCLFASLSAERMQNRIEFLSNWG